MSIPEKTISSLGQLIDAVTPQEPSPASGRRRDTGVYHGSASVRHPLLTTLDRLGGSNPPPTKAHLEEHILRKFRRYSRPHLTTQPANDRVVRVLAHHHGVPTRL